MYDALVSADIVTDDPDGAAAVLVDLLDLPEPRPNAFLEPAGHGFRAAWLRTQPSLAVAPTRIELIGSRPRSAPHDYVEERIVAQGARPVRTHATVLAGDVGAVLEQLARARVPHRVTPASEDFDFERVWVGVTTQDPTRYSPAFDAGLWLEIVPTASSGVPPFPDDGRVPAGPGVRRVRARRFLVDDLATAEGALESNLGLTASSLHRDDNGSTATYLLRHPLSAAIELHQPTAGSPAASHRERWGAGPDAIVLEVGDLDFVADRLAERGVVSRSARTPMGERSLTPDPARTLDVPFELVEAN